MEIKPGVYRVNASMKLDDLNDRLELHLESEEYDSLGGLVIGLLDHLPEEDEKVEEDGLQMTVEHVDKNRNHYFNASHERRTSGFRRIKFP